MKKLLALLLFFLLQIPCFADGVPVNGTPSTFPGSAIKANTVDSGQVEVVTLQHYHRQFTSAEIKALSGTPITILSAPGSGKYYGFLRSSLKLNYGGTTYTGGSSVIVKDSAANQLASFSSSTITGAADTYTTSSVALATKTTFNSALTFTVSGSNFATGNGTADLDILYVVIP